MDFTTATINIQFDSDSGKVRMHAPGGFAHTGWHTDPQDAWDQLAAALGPQLVAAARRAQQPIPADI